MGYTYIYERDIRGLMLLLLLLLFEVPLMRDIQHTPCSCFWDVPSCLGPMGVPFCWSGLYFSHAGLEVVGQGVVWFLLL